MQLLWISPFLPWPLRFGATIRIYHLIRVLSRWHEIDLAALSHGAELPEELKKITRSIALLPPDYSYRRAQIMALLSGAPHLRVCHQSRALNEWIAQRAGNYQGVVAEETHMSWTPLPAKALPILDTHNIEHELLARTAATDPNRLRSLYRHYEASKLEKAERAIFRQYPLIATCSERETQILGGWNLPGRVVTIPNGVDTQRFDPATPLPPEAMQLPCPDIVFIGTTHYYPNEQAILHFHDNIWPRILEKRPQTTFGALGGKPKPSIQRLIRDNFQVLGMVPDVFPYFRRAKLLAVPLLSGGGTRLKILEASAAQTPVVTTSMGCEGIPLKDGVHARIADTPEAFAAACLDLLEHPETGPRLAAEARRLVAVNFDWNAIGKRLHEAIEQAAQSVKTSKATG